MQYLDKNGVETFWSCLKKYSAEYCVTKDYVDTVLENYHAGKYPKEYGVYILDTNDKYYDPDDWDTANNDTVVGICVYGFTGAYLSEYVSSAFIISLEDIGTSYWGSRTLLIDGCYTNEGASGSSNDNHLPNFSDFNGASNTNAIIAAQGNAASGYAAYKCKNYTFANGNSGYLPTITELEILSRYIDDVNNALTLVGGSEFGSGNRYWSSTQVNTEYAYRMVPNGTTSAYFGYKDKNMYIRAFSVAP